VFPDLPSIGETIPGYDVSLYYCVSAPRGTPPDVIAILNKGINAALADPKMKVRIAEFGGTPLSLTPAEFGKLVADETEKWAKVVNTVGLSID
jgi:tripartite-type tricarboxylate transporter receptor subunit TctC